MNNKGEIMPAICIGVIVANFLLNTCRVLKAIELCKECFIILENKADMKDDGVITVSFKLLYSTMFQAYYLVEDYTRAIHYGKNLLPFSSKQAKEPKKAR